jgi:Tfp pilus assembly protein PilF
LKKRGKLEEALAELREAIRLKPDFAEARYELGNSLRDQGKLEQAVAEYREAIRLTPDLAEAHGNLGNVLADQGELEHAVAEHREAIRLKPNHAGFHSNLGGTLRAQGKLEEAIAQCREAIRLQPSFPLAHGILGLVLRTRGEFNEAIVEFRKAHDLARTNPPLAEKIDGDLVTTERLAATAARLPAVLSGKSKPTDAAETLGFAQLCYEKKLHEASARLWGEAFHAQPKLAEDMRSQHRYNAACAAALAGCGQGKDDPPLDEPAKARWRRQAINWLKADLAAWSKLLQTGAPQAKQGITQTLQHWKADADLGGVRDPTAVAKLPPDEQQTCRALWAKVDALLTKATGATP